jgi:hypothetical protein
VDKDKIALKGGESPKCIDLRPAFEPGSSNLDHGQHGCVIVDRGIIAMSTSSI